MLSIYLFIFILTIPVGNAFASSEEGSTLAFTVAQQTPTIGHYNVVQNGQLCLLSEFNATLLFTYQKLDNSSAQVVLAVPADAKVGGVCGANVSLLVLTFKNETRSLTFAFYEENDIVYLKSCNISYLVDDDFPDAKYAGALLTVLGLTWNQPLSNASESFECESAVGYVIAPKELEIVLARTRFQVFHVKNDAYSPAARSPMDVMTTVETTSVQTSDEPDSTITYLTTEVTIETAMTTVSQTATTAATTTPTTTTSTTTTAITTTSTTTTTTTDPPTPPNNFFTVTGHNGVICLVIDMEARFSIDYKVKNGRNSTADVSVPYVDQESGRGGAISGTCGDDVNTLFVEFFNGWKLKLDFEKDSSFFSLENITFVYNTNSSEFIDPAFVGESVSMGTKLGLFKANLDFAYRCRKPIDATLNGTTMSFSYVQVQAFSTKKSDEFEEPDECDIDFPEPDGRLVGGAAIGGVLVVLITVTVWTTHRIRHHRRQRRRQQWHVNEIDAERSDHETTTRPAPRRLRPRVESDFVIDAGYAVLITERRSRDIRLKRIIGKEFHEQDLQLDSLPTPPASPSTSQ